MVERRFGKCPKCGQTTPLKTGDCLYCGTPLKDAASASDRVPQMHEEPRQLGGPARFQRQSDDRGHFLVVDTRDPVALDPGKLFVIGRDPRSSLLVHAPDVSRQHCEIDWKGDPPRALLCEVRSKLGTFLNGKLVRRDSPEPLRDGDEIRLGHFFTIVYRNVAEHQLKEDLLQAGRDATRENRLPAPPSPRAPEPAPSRLEPALAPSSGPRDEGDLATTPVATLLGHLYNNRRTGVLTIFDGSGTGEVMLVDGRAKKVVFGSLASRQALEHIARLKSGAYRFRPEEPPSLGEAPMPPAIAAMLEPEQAPFPPPPPLFPMPTPAGLAPIGEEPDPVGGASFADMIAAMLSVQETRRLREDAAVAHGSAPQKPPSQRLEAQPPYAASSAPPYPAPHAADAAAVPGTNRVLPLRGAPDPLASSDPIKPSTAKRQRETGAPPLAPASGATGRGPRPVTEPSRPTRATGGASGDELVRPVVQIKTGQQKRPPTKTDIPIPPISDPAFRPETGQMRPPIEQSLPRGTASWGSGSPSAEKASPVAGLVATARAAGLKGEALGIFAGEAAVKLLDEGNLAAMVELAEEAFALAESGTFEVALSTRLTLRSFLGTRERLERCADLVDVALVTSGPASAGPLAGRLLKVLKDDGPTPPDTSTPLGRIAAVAGPSPRPY